MNLSDRARNSLVLVVFAVVFTGLCVNSYRQKSATWDEPHNVLRGILGWRGDNRMDPEHPPFLRLWAALPVAFDKTVTLDTDAIDNVSPADWVGDVQYQYAQHFLYKVNKADSILYRARFMIVLLGLLLGGLLFAWTNEWLGFWPAATALALYSLEPNLMAHASLVTTDFGATCFMFGTLYFLWRTTRQRSFVNITGAILFFALAMISKYTTLMLAPVIVALLVVDSCRKPNRRRSLTVSAGILAGMVAVTWLAMWAAYGFRYAPSTNPNWLYRFQESSPFGDHFPIFARLAVWADNYRLLPNACTQGFLLGQIKAQSRGSYLFGQLSGTGWWYYFPVAFLLKTPVTMLFLMTGGLLVVLSRWRRLLDMPLFILLPPAFIVGLAMTQKLNIGLRHILPVYPLALMLCAIAVAWLLHELGATSNSRWGQPSLLPHRRWWILPCILLMGFEARQAYPSPLAFFNIFVGGSRHGSEYLVDSNLDWGQDLKGLHRWMESNELKNIYLCYFGTADPAYYGIQYTALPGNGFMDAGQLPTGPGYIAISATNLRGVYFPDDLREFYAPLLKQEPLRRIGYSIFIYRIERPWWP